MPYRRPEPGADDLLIKIAASVLVLTAVAFGYNKLRDGIDDRTEAIAEASRPAAAHGSQPLPSASEFSEPPARAMVQLLRKCSGPGSATFTTEACPAGTQEVGARIVPIDTSIGPPRQSAQAQLRQAQQDFQRAVAAEQPADVWYPTGGLTPAEARRTECERVKAERDEAYRRRNNDRSFNFIRYWQDRVFVACKDA